MRVIAGSAKGRKLKTLEGLDVRPTTDKVKEAIFSAIQFDLPGAVVLDLFAGSGQMGIEALSRGAETAVFVDRSARSLQMTKDYLEAVQLAAQAQKLEELTLKIEDVDNLIDEVSSVAYDKAVELVTDEVKTMTHQEDIDMIEDTKVWLQSPERKAPKKERDYAVARLDGVVRRIRKAMQSTLEKMKAVLLHADKKQSITEEIKTQTKPSIVEALRRGMEEQRKKDSEKQAQEKQKKQNMEL